MTVLPLEKVVEKLTSGKIVLIESHPIAEGSIASLSLFTPKERCFY
jgi:dihydroorotase